MLPDPTTPRPAPACDYDDRHRRLNDFELPSPDGRPASATSTPISYCSTSGAPGSPCVKSIPHLVDLQRTPRGKKLAVIGIACEKDGGAVARVLDTVQRLRMNYMVLLEPERRHLPPAGGSAHPGPSHHGAPRPRGPGAWARRHRATPPRLARLDRMIARHEGERRTSGRY
ncbi:MAG: hypothetical protein U0835_20530 [Isosphaeraceae bacterium]